MDRCEIGRGGGATGEGSMEETTVDVAGVDERVRFWI